MSGSSVTHADISLWIIQNPNLPSSNISTYWSGWSREQRALHSPWHTFPPSPVRVVTIACPQYNLSAYSCYAPFTAALRCCWMRCSDVWMARYSLRPLILAGATAVSSTKRRVRYSLPSWLNTKEAVRVIRYKTDVAGLL